MKLRKATFNDWKVLLDWRNDPLTRKNSFTQEIVKEENHKKWFRKNLIDETSNLFILETKTNEPVGTIRSDEIDNNSYLLSWNISPNHRKKGHGSLILNLFLQNKIGMFTAEIKPENLASIKMVEKNGFKRVNEQTYKKVMTDLEIIDAVEAVRTKNNKNWMDILRVAFKHASKEARPILSEINKGDGEISKLLDQLANNE
tara:strand:+ start:43 stop:645 length:603 start_codon:yes stop_codon:yes gene_type:complete